MVVVWSAFILVDWIIGKLGDNYKALKSAWNAAILHVPFGWTVWVVGILVIVILMTVDGSYRQDQQSQTEIKKLIWPEARPKIIFDSWVEVPHDHPDARFHEATTHKPEREYFERGIFVVNDGETAHEVYIPPIELYPGLHTQLGFAGRIDAHSKGFIFISLNIEETSHVLGVLERWNLLDVMSRLEGIVNANSTNRIYSVKVNAVYRDLDNVHYMSTTEMSYGRDAKKIVFYTTQQRPLGTVETPAT